MNLTTAHMFFVTLAALVASAFAAGGNMAPCRSDSHCAGDRSCRALMLDLTSIIEVAPESTIDDLISGNVDPFDILFQILKNRCDDDDEYCACVPLKEELIQCSSDSDCSDGEQCFEGIDAVGKSCLVGVQAQLLTPPRPCSGDSDCTPDTTCVTVVAEGVCLARFKKSTTSEKPDSSSSTTSGSSNNSNNDEDDNDDDEVCVAVKSLRHLQSHQLVYRKHMAARVLCDEHGSCATAGHMVRFRGRAMMMKSYCELVGNCERSITLVNSPRYTRALQIPSDSPDLTFTAFAARYATAAEEHVLRTAVHIGL